MRLGLSFLALLSFSLPAWSASELYQPTLGDRFRYLLSNGDAVETKVIRVSQDPPETIATLERTVVHGGTRRSTRVVLLRSPEGFAFRFPHAAHGAQLGPLVYYWAKAELRQVWLAQRGQYRDLSGENVAFEIQGRYEGNETLKVPAGVFQDCWRLSFWGSPASERPTLMTMWVKPDVGIIKTRSLEGSSTLETELVEFAIAKDAHSTP